MSIKATKLDSGEIIVSRSIAAAMLGINVNTLALWLNSENPPPFNEVHRGFDANQLGHWIRKQQTLRKGVGGARPYLPEGVVMVEDVKPAPRPMTLPSAMPAALDYNEERTRKEAAAADKLELNNAVMRGEYVAVADVEKGWTSILSRVKTRIMQVPYNCAVLVVGETDMSVIQAKIKEAVSDALLELSEDWQNDKEDDDE